MKVAAVAIGLSLLAGAAAMASGYAQQPSKPVELSGSWQLNGALSDDIQKLVEEQRAKLRKLRERESERRRPERDPEAGLYPSEEEVMGPVPTASLQRPELAVERYDRLTIEQTSEHFVVQVENPSGHIERSSYDPGAQSVVSFGPGVADRRAGWKGRSFVIETRALNGARRQEIYMLDGANHLIVRTVISGRGPKLEVKQVYDRASRPPEDSNP